MRLRLLVDMNLSPECRVPAFSCAINYRMGWEG